MEASSRLALACHACHAAAPQPAPANPSLPCPSPLPYPVQALHTLAGDGRTIVFCIHQPRSSIYAMFDQLLLISEGRLCYFGPAAAAAAHFAAAGHPCPPGHSVADFLLDVTSTDFRSPEAEAASRERVRALADLCAAQGGAATKVRAGTASSIPSRHACKVLRRQGCCLVADAPAPLPIPTAMQEAGPDAQLIVAARAAEQPTAGSSVAEEDELPKFANNPLREFQLLLGRVSAALWPAMRVTHWVPPLRIC